MKTIFCSIALASTLVAPASSVQAQDSEHVYTNAHGREVIVRSGMPKADRYGPKPSFAELDRNHDGSISRAEAEAFPPLANDFDFVAQNGERISPRQFARWDYR